MSLGLGTFLSTLTIALLVIYRGYGARKVFKAIGLVLAATVAVVSAGLGVNWFLNRPVAVTKYYDVSLGMTHDGASPPSPDRGHR